MVRPLLIAIGVHNAKGLEKIEAALLNVAEICAWGAKNGYETLAFRDDPALPASERDVTVPKMTAALTPDVLLDRPRIIVYFCGHGLHAPRDQHWVLSAGPGQRRVSAGGFRDALGTYGAKQVAIFSDACRTPWVDGVSIDNIVDNYEGAAGKTQKEFFYSTREGEPSYAMPAKDGKPAYCIFTKALIEGLNASSTEFEVLDEQYLQGAPPRRVISSQSLTEYLEEAVPAEAIAVHRMQRPTCNPGFLYPNNIYVDLGGASPSGPEKSHDLTAAPPEFDGGPPQESVLRNRTRAAMRDRHRAERRDLSRSEWRGQFVKDAFALLNRLSVGDNSMLVDTGDALRDAQVEVVAQHGAPRFAAATGEHMFTVDVVRGSASAIVFVNGYATPVMAFRDLRSALAFGPSRTAPPRLNAPRGADLLSWSSSIESHPDAVAASVEALKGLSAGYLRTSDVPTLTAEMRWGKHQNPLLGIIAAYLYNDIGDLDAIHRMAYFYHFHGQDLPFDIALLARVPFEIKDNQFWVHIPATEETPPAQRLPNAPSFTWSETPTTHQPVAGLTPTLRAGWQMLDAKAHRIHRACATLTHTLTNSTISTFEGDASARGVRRAFEDFWSGKI